MTQLLVISVGPVQEFIAAARRTRDLWFGSYMLSEISKSVAQTVQEEGGTLIFPSSPDNTSVANIILAELSDECTAKKISDKARAAAQVKWKEFANDAKSRVGQNMINSTLWNNQIKDAIEFYSAWVPVHGNYQAARNRVMRLLAGRKNCRDFSPAPAVSIGIPKSSLDGRRESVLLRGGTSNRVFDDGEQLCAIGLTKRMTNRHYPSVARIAADPWLRGIRNHRAYPAFKRACESQGEALNRLDPNQYPQYAAFPFDGAVAFKDRLPILAREFGFNVAELESGLRALHVEAWPYLAVLMADGDNMGQRIAGIDSPEGHRQFSQQLSDFSAGVPDVVKQNNGVCVFAGGDDLLVFLPVDKALVCACEIYKNFKDSVGSTLSIGIAIGHCMEPLEDLRAYAIAAEKKAKGEKRNGLAVMIHSRSGASFGVRGCWQEQEPIQTRLDAWAKCFAENKLPNKLPYDLRILALSRRDITGPEIQAELRVLLKRKTNASNLDFSEVARHLQSCDSADKLLRLAEEMLVSQWIAASLRQAMPTITEEHA